MISYDTLSEAQLVENGEIPQDEIRQSIEQYGEMGKPQDALTQPRNAEDDDKKSEVRMLQEKSIKEIADQIGGLSQSISNLLSNYQEYKSVLDDYDLQDFFNQHGLQSQAKILNIDSLQYDVNMFQVNQSPFLDFLTNNDDGIEKKTLEANKFVNQYRAKLDSIDTDISQLSDAVLVSLSTIDTVIRNANWEGNNSQNLEVLRGNLNIIQSLSDRLTQINSQIMDQLDQLEKNTQILSKSFDE